MSAYDEIESENKSTEEEQVLLLKAKDEKKDTKPKNETRFQRFKRWCGEFCRAEHVLIEESSFFKIIIYYISQFIRS